MTPRDKKSAVWGVGLVLVGIPVVMILREAHMAADYSAHAALAAEIEQQLAVIQPGQPYPDSLSQLRLTYPDGGSTSLLSRFAYHSTGTNCTLRTVLGGEEIVRSFP